jgi:hypothetical protein
MPNAERHSFTEYHTSLAFTKIQVAQNSLSVTVKECLLTYKSR